MATSVRPAPFFSLVLVVACGAKPEPTAVPPAAAPEVTAPSTTSTVTPAASASSASAPAQAGDPFPLVDGTSFTFRGKKRDGSDHTWTTTLVAIDKAKRLFQYQPHNDIANFFSKAGLQGDPSGIHIVGESLDGSVRAPALAIAFPITAGAAKDVPGLFPCKYTVVGREAVKVPAGSFEAWKITLKDNVNPEGAAWIAPGTGLVKIQLPGGRVDELVSIGPAHWRASNPYDTDKWMWGFIKSSKLCVPDWGRAPPVEEPSLLGLFADEPDLIDEVCRMAMEARYLGWAPSLRSV